eukprot:scpid87015/ scgid7710/ 
MVWLAKCAGQTTLFGVMFSATVLWWINNYMSGGPESLLMTKFTWRRVVSVRETQASGSFAKPVETLTIRSGTFSYLVMGPSEPPTIWRNVSQNADVFVIYLSWKKRPVTMIRTAKYKTSHHGNSSWASGRNKLLSLALETEQQQRWRFEYFVFWDSDVRLIYRHNQTGFLLDSHEKAEAHFRKLLLRDRPARAGVQYPGYRDWIPTYETKCLDTCRYDACVDAFHRTTVEHVLPYPPQFDKYNWWMASETVTFRSAALFAHHCNKYQEIVVDAFLNQHGRYIIKPNFFAKAAGQYLHCLAGASSSAQTYMYVISHGVADTDRTAGNCAAHPPGVDYTAGMTSEQWRIRQCSFDTEFSL